MGKRKPSVFTGTLLWLCPQTMDIYSLLSTISSSFVWDEIQKMACFLTADRQLSFCHFLHVVQHCRICLHSSPMVYCLLLSKTFSWETGSIVAVSLSRSGPRHPCCWIKRWELNSGGQECLGHPPPGLIGSGPPFNGSCDPWETQPYQFENCSVFPCLSSSTWWNRNCSCLYGLNSQCRYYVIYIKMLM